MSGLDSDLPVDTSPLYPRYSLDTPDPQNVVLSAKANNVPSDDWLPLLLLVSIINRKS